MNYKKIISSLLLVSLLVNSIAFSNYTAKAASINDNIIYYDGIGFTASVDDSGNLTVSSLSKGADSASITVYKDGHAQAIISNDTKIDNYNLQIRELNDKKIDINVFQKNKKVKEYKNFTELKYDKYVGQADVFDAFIYSLSLLIEVLLILIISVVIAGITYYSIAYVIETVRDVAEDNPSHSFYYRADVVGPQVVIDLYNPIIQTQAVSRLAGQLDIYTYYSTAAAYACTLVGNAGSCVGAEIDQDRKLGYVYFYHYHVNRTNPAHAFFGLPFTL